MKKFIVMFILLTSIFLNVNHIAAVKLIDGEKRTNGMIEGIEERIPANHHEVSLRGVEPSGSPNYATSKETAQFFYRGYIQFMPAYKTKQSDCCGLVPYRHVKRAYIAYERDGKDVSSGNNFTETATSKTDTRIYSTEITATDNLLPGDKYTTYFVRKWFYFDD